MGDKLKGVHLLPQQDYEKALVENQIDDDVIYVTPEDFSALAREQVRRIDKNEADIAVNKQNITTNSNEILTLKSETSSNTSEIVNVKNTITDIIVRDTNQDNRLTEIENNYANKSNVVTLSDTQTITGLKTFTEHIYLANSDGTVDRISHLNNNFIIHSGATNSAVLNIDEGLSKIYAFNKELAFKSDILDASGTLVKIAGVTVSDLSFTSDPQQQIDALIEDSSAAVDSKVSKSGDTMTGELVATAGVKFGNNKIESTNSGNTLRVSHIEDDEFDILNYTHGGMLTVNNVETPLILQGYDDRPTYVSGSGVMNDLALESDIPTKVSQLTNDANYDTVSSVDAKIAALVDSAPETLDTLAEVAQAIKDNETVVDALNSAIGNKADKTELVKYLPLTGGVLTGTIQAPLFKSDESPAAFKLSANNELNFGSNGSDMYIGYDSTKISDTNAKVSVYHFGNSDKIGNGGTIYCNKLYVSNGTQEVAVKDDLNDYLPLTGGVMSGDIHTPDGGGISFTSRYGVKFLLYGHSNEPTVHVRITDEYGVDRYYPLIDAHGRLYSRNDEVAVKSDLALYQHSFGLTVSGSNWRSYGINLILPNNTKFTISTFAKWLYDRGYRAYNRNDATGTCLWLAGSNFGAGGGYGTPLAVFSPDGSSIKVQISGSNTLSEDAVNTIVAYSVRDVFGDSIIN